MPRLYRNLLCGTRVTCVPATLLALCDEVIE